MNRDKQETGHETEQTAMVIRQIGRYIDMNRDKQETGQETEQTTMIIREIDIQT